MFKLRFVFRRLAQSPGFTVTALVTLALGIGLNAAMFNIVNALLLQPLKFPEADRLFRLERISPEFGNGGHRPAHYVAMADAAGDLADLSCSRQWSFTVTLPDRPPEVLGALRASPGYFHVLGLEMALGREFVAAENHPGNNRVVILSHALWRTQFNADPTVIGRVVRVDGEPNEIIGVASPLAADSRTIGAPELYRPLAFTAAELELRGPDRAFDIIGRFRPGITTGEATSRLATITASLTTIDPTDYEGRMLRASSLQPELRGSGALMVGTLVGLSGFVLLIACANLANLLLARALARHREFAIRGALGASRWQLIRPLLGECILLAVIGGALGMLVCSWTNAWMAREFAISGSAIAFVTDWTLLAYAFAVSLLTGVFFGVAPAWMISRVAVNDALKGGARGTTGDRSQHRVRQVLIAGQVALALVLLSGAVFFVRGLEHILTREAGWNLTRVLRGILVVPESRYTDTAAISRFYDQVIERVVALPGVEAATICHDVPAFGFKSGRGFIIEGQPPATPGGASFGAPTNGVSPGYFATMGTRVLRGRDFGPMDRIDSAPVIILNETMARALFPDENPIGKRLAYSDEPEKWIEVVGVAEDVQFLNFGDTTIRFQSYIPLSQAVWSYVALCVRTAVPPATMGDTLRRAVAEIDPDMPVKELSLATEFIGRSLQDFRAIIQLLIGFATLGLFLAALGIYSVIARLVAQRTSEIGIRIALGAQVAHIARLILGAGLRIVLIGTGVGLVLAIALTHVLTQAMPALATTATPGLAGAVALLIGIALLACWLPARRATKVDPLEALRAE